MTSMEKLNQIRQNIANRNNPLIPKCPKCSHPLTIDTTEFFETEFCENCFDHAIIKSLDQCCNSQNLHFVKLMTAAGTIQVRQQCQSCGSVKPNSLGGFTKEQREAFPLVDETLRKSKESIHREMVRSFYGKISDKRKAQYIEKLSEKRALYYEYLNSPQWETKRNLVLKRDKNLCQCCLDALMPLLHRCTIRVMSSLICAEVSLLLTW